MCSEALISECSSLLSCALMHKPVLFTEVYTSMQVSQALDHILVEQLKCRSSIWGSSSEVPCWTQDQLWVPIPLGSINFY